MWLVTHGKFHHVVAKPQVVKYPIPFSPRLRIGSLISLWINVRLSVTWSYNLACRTPERLGSDDEEDSLSSPTSRSSRLSRSLRNGEIIPRNSHQNSSNNDGGAICHEEMAAADCYEKRIAFIQKQHEKMLAALHREVEQLKRKNKGFMTWWSCQGCPAFFFIVRVVVEYQGQKVV